ncbi:melanocyte-stimulating hormone receptor-like [Acropora muricata]|uniref:melanocyte-stimulating hormone receptor-like n=1 Tax=Acropora muricata TaxID=159855 RepID=UPI0034E4D4EB
MWSSLGNSTSNLMGMMVEDTPAKPGLHYRICYHFTRTHFDMEESSPVWYIFNCVVNVVFSVISTLSNLLILVAIRRSPSLHTPSVAFLFGLALSDLGVGLIVQPLFFLQTLAKVIRHKSLFCVAGISAEISANALCLVSLLTVTAVGVDKLVALLLHLRYKELVTIKRVIVVLLCVWLFSTAFGSLCLWRYQPIKTISISIITLCLLIGTYSYVKIYRIVAHHRSRIKAQCANVLQPVEKHVHTENLNLVNMKKQAIGTFLVFCILAVCFTPYLCTIVVIETHGLTTARRISFELTATLIFINSSLNPLIYCWRLREVNVAVRRTWDGFFS